MKSDVDSYLEQTSRHLLSVDPLHRADMLLELQTHLEDSMAGRAEEGEDHPMKAIVAQMGPPALVGKALARADRSRLRAAPRVVILRLILIILAGLAPLLARAATARLPTYQYYGKVLSAYDKLAFFEANVPLHCAELPSAERYVNEQSLEIDYVCFNTAAELAAYSEGTLRPQWERLAQEYPDASRARPNDPGDPNAQQSGENSVQADHWALYANGRLQRMVR